MTNDPIDRDLFTDPPAEFRPIPFWGLNDDLDDDVIREQIREMKDKGWGGFFTHARYGLETPYLSDEYMERMRTAVDAAKEHGIEAWIYDEHPFPAGTAGGQATAPNKDFRSKALVGRMHNRLTPIDPDEAVAYFALELDENGVPTSARRVTDPETDTGREHHFLHLYVWTEPLHQAHQPGFSNYDDNIIHGFASSDNLNPAAVRKFIDVTYENFKSSVGDEFGATLKGGFSDIPVYNWNYASPHPSIPWTTGFAGYFEAENGYDLVPELASLFYDLGDSARVRADYWRTANKLFLESFTKQLYGWFAENDLTYIAHYWGEETLHWQIPWTGDVMSHFVHHHYVGMDHSIRNIEDPLGIKQASTVAEQLGKPRMAAETYGMAGNNLTHAERRWIGDWEYALGTNFLIPYVALYSFRGRRKRDEPSSLFIQQPYWEFERLLYDYYGRLSYALTRGDRVVDTLVMQPLATAWTKYKPSNDYPQAHRPDPLVFEGAGAELFDYNQQWMDLCDNLLAWHRDFHVGNEAVMAEFASVDGARLKVGRAEYSVVVVPPSTTWSAATTALLQEFIGNGGSVIVVEPTPSMIDGVPAEEPLSGATVVADIAGSLHAAIDEVGVRDIRMPDEPDVLYAHRTDGADDVYFVANTSLETAHLDYEVSIPGGGTVEVWDAMTGERSVLPTATHNGSLHFSLDLYPVNSVLLVRTQRTTPELPRFEPCPRTVVPDVPLDGPWKVTTEDPNVLAIDYAQVRVGTSDWTPLLPVWKASRAAKQGGIGSRYTVRFTFELAEPVAGLRLLVEQAEHLEVTVNGQALDMSGRDWWLDPTYSTAPVSNLLRVGTNLIEYSGILGIGTDIENVLLLGDMHVDRNHRFLVSRSRGIVTGTDITYEGFPFFTGRVVLSQGFRLEEVTEPVYVSFDRIDTTYARVRVNGKDVGELPWQPFTLDITDALQNGENTLEVELVTTRHNLFGPHHDKRGEVRKFAAPHIWTNEVQWTDDYFFMPLGVTGVKIGRAQK